MIPDDAQKLYHPDDQVVLNEIVNRLQNQVSKLTSQRLHLQALIAKRDRLDYEIKTLKQVIRRTKQVSTRKGTPLREEADLILRTAEAEPNYVIDQSVIDKVVEEKVIPIVAQLRSEEELLEILERLPRLTDE